MSFANYFLDGLKLRVFIPTLKLTAESKEALLLTYRLEA